MGGKAPKVKDPEPPPGQPATAKDIERDATRMTDEERRRRAMNRGIDSTYYRKSGGGAGNQTLGVW